MVLFKNYFSNQTILEGEKIVNSVVNLKKEDNKVSATVFGEKVSITFEENQLVINSNCSSYDCKYIYALLAKLEKQEYERFEKEIDSIRKYRIELFNEELSDSIKDYSSVKTILLSSADYRKDCKVISSDKYIELVKKLCSFSLDTHINTGNLLNNTTLKYEIQTFITFELSALLNLKEYNTVFEIIKILIEYFINLESINHRLLEETIDLLMENLGKLMRKTKRSDLRYDIFNWLLDLAQYSYNSIILTEIRAILYYNFNRVDFLYEKEELSLVMYQRTLNTNFDDIIHNGNSWIIKRKRLNTRENELEYWFNFHLNVLEKLDYSEFEITQFLIFAEDVYPAQNMLLDFYDNREDKTQFLETIRKLINNPKTSIRDRGLFIKRLEENISDYRLTDEYKDLIQNIVFDEGIPDSTLINDYINLLNDYKDDLDYLIELMKDSPDYWLLNKLYYENNDKDKLFRNLILKEDIDEIFKYEDYLIDDYGDDLVVMIEPYFKNLPKNYKRKDYYKIPEEFKHLKKYPNYKLSLKSILRDYKHNYHGMGPIIKEINNILSKKYKKSSLDDFF